MQRSLYIAAYDIREAKRLQQMRHTIRDFASGGQKSVFECWLSPKEKHQLIEACKQVMQSEDSLLVIRLTNNKCLYQLGIASSPRNENFHYFG